MADRSASLASTDSNALKKTESYQYPAAHFNHLDNEQDKKLEQFKQLCTSKGYYKPATADHPRASHDDETLLRYLRARKFVPQDAFKQFRDTEDWRKDNEIDKLYDTIDIAEYDETRRLYPQWTGRRDKRGIPVYVFEIAGLNSKRMSEYQSSLSSKASQNPKSGNISPNLRRLFALYENLIQFTMPLCSALPTRPFPDTPVSQSNNIVDISKTGLKQFWNLKGHMQEASTLATAHYPETLDRIFILGAPSFFPTVWSWIKRWFDPITVSKIFILTQNDMYKTLSEYIDPENIPKKYGGKLDWEWGHLPNLDEDITRTLDWKKPATGSNGERAFPPGPIRWRASDDGKSMAAVAMGTDKGKQREDVVATLPIPRDQVVNNLPTRPGLDRLASTTGTHTQPADDVETFSPSGQTPTDTPSGSDAQSLSSGAKLDGAIAAGAAGTGAAAVGAADYATHNSQTAAERQNETRQGTSHARQEAQTGTHAEGVQDHATPAVIDHGHGDKTKTMEPGTIGQAPKDITVPEATPQKDDAEQAPGYVDQAKSAAAGAAATVSGITAGLASKVGLGSGKSEEEARKVEEERRQEEEKSKDDPEVDKLGDVEVEDFLRNKYATHQDPSIKVKKAAAE